MTDNVPEATTTTVTTAADNAEIVQKFLFAMAQEDFDTVESLAAPDLLWQNVGLPSLRGRARIMNLLRRGQGRMGFAVKFHRIAQEGGTVLTERTDALIFGPVRLQFWVCGTFEVHNGQIELWRDYFDFFDIMVKAPLRAALAALIPSKRVSF
ncbi:MAG: nuclear transport factor 2 family protein [Mycobacterium sp.]|nr:nuclear transport factor 2 family protein [Mycobacterium sp.]